MITAAKIHNIVRSIVEPTLEAGGDVADAFVVLERVVAGVVLISVEPGGGEEIALDSVMEGAKEWIAEYRLDNVAPAGTA